jgi:hypothetical protein
MRCQAAAFIPSAADPFPAIMPVSLADTLFSRILYHV